MLRRCALGLVFVFLVATLATGARAQSATLRSPFADLMQRIPHASGADDPCPKPPAAVKDVVGVSYYVDAHHSIVDPKKLAQNEANLNPIRDYLKHVTGDSDAAVRGDAGAARCALQWLFAWAASNAMLGNVNHQGEYEREWTLDGLALAYLKIRDSGVQDPNGAQIPAWFSRLARAVEPFYPPTGELNNHDYWAGVGVAAAGIAANDRALFDWGIATYKTGVDQITPQGTLPLEMRRGTRALHYHLFAIEPLVMLAEMGRANGMNLYAMNGGAIQRLAKRCVEGILNPAYFAERSGFAQDITAGRKLRTDEIAWMEPYQARYPSSAMLSVLSGYRPVVYERLGGNLTQLYVPAAHSPASAVLSVMERVADWQMTHRTASSSRPPTDWTLGVYDTGMIALAGISPNSKYRDAMLAVGAATHWRPGKRPYFADDQTVSQMYLALYKLYGEKAMLAPTQAEFDTILAHPPARPNDLGTAGKLQKWVWCDALFMAPPAFAQLSEVAGDRKYLDYMDEQFWRTVNYLYDRKQHLFFRDDRYFNKHEANGQPIFWGRGNGWVLAGIARVLQAMPDTYPSRPKYVRLYRELAARLAGLQDGHGAWHASLLDPKSYPEPEMSSTALIDYGMAWGVNSGLLDARVYAPKVLAGWGALVQRVQPDGRLGLVQPVGANPKHTSLADSDVYGTGAFLLAGSEIYKLQLLRTTPHIIVGVSNPIDLYRFSETLELDSPGIAAELKTTPEHLAVIDGAGARIIQSQVTSKTAGSAADALIFQTDIAPKASQHFAIVAMPADVRTPAPIVKTFARFVPERMDDFAWENDRIAHRVYGPALITGEGTNNSGIDVWVKSVRKPVINEWYKKANYHVDHGEGLDCYDNGSSRGDGGSGVWANDTLFVPNNFVHWQLVSSGPIRAEFILTYATWRAGGRDVTEVKRFTLDAGSNMTRIVDTFESPQTSPLDIGVAIVSPSWSGRKQHLRVARNLVRENEPAADPKGHFSNSPNGDWIAAWQENGVPPRNTISAGATGTAAVMPQDEHPAIGYATGHEVLNSRVTPGHGLVYFVGAGWTKGDFPDANAWEQYVATFAEREQAPLLVTVSKPAH